MKYSKLDDDQTPRPITLYFRNREVTLRFIGLCQKLGYRGKTKLEGQKYIVTTQPLPPKARSALVAQWGEMTVDRSGFKTYHR